MRTSALFLLLVAIVATNAVAPLLHADSPTVIPGSYIVMMKDGVSKLDRDAHVLSIKDTIMATNANAEIGFVYTSFMGFSARLTEDLLKAELAHPDVKYVEADQVMSIAAVTQYRATWGIARISQRQKGVIVPNGVNNNYTYASIGGIGVDVYVIDTGIYVAHSEFALPDGKSRATAVFNSITNEANNDLNGHGTHCAGTIGGTLYGVSKNVTLYAVKVLNSGGSGSTAGVAAGVDYVTNNADLKRAPIASMSLGGGASSVMDDAVANSIAKGISYAIAAGNSNANTCNYSPARVPTAVTVGASAITDVSAADSRATYSNFGTCNTVFAPGTSVTSAWIGSPTATNTISGTSMATPHVAGALAMRASQLLPTVQTPAAAKQWIIDQATEGIVTNPGTGTPNRLLFQDPNL